MKEDNPFKQEICFVSETYDRKADDDIAMAYRTERQAMYAYLDKMKDHLHVINKKLGIQEMPRRERGG